MKKLYLEITLRESGPDVAIVPVFYLPVTRCWWEDVSNDLHLQFEGFEDINILPTDNARKGEMKIPKRAEKFRAWLKSWGAPHKGHIHICSNMLEVISIGKKDQVPPPEVMKDLVHSWKSPNRNR